MGHTCEAFNHIHCRVNNGGSSEGYLSVNVNSNTTGGKYSTNTSSYVDASDVEGVLELK